MTFQELIQAVESKIGKEVTKVYWKCKPLEITERRENMFRLRCLFTHTSEFSFEKEFKFVESNFDTDTKYNNEILRFLNRLDDFSTSNFTTTSPNLTANWKGFISKVTQIDPIHISLTITYAKTGMSFDKQLDLYAESFLDKQFYVNQVLDNVSKLNSPIGIEYYQNLI